MKFVARYLLIVLSLFNSSFSNDIPEPYRSIKDLPFDSQGWFINADPLKNLLNVKPAKIVIEVGCWLGASTRFLASTIPADGVVYAVDNWIPTEIHYINDSRLPFLYQLFLSNVKHVKLTHKIIPVRMDSLEAAQALNVQADLIYIDANHSTAAVYKDIIAWSSHLAKDGIICGDDWESWESVKKGVIQAAEKLNKDIGTSGNCWWLY